MNVDSQLFCYKGIALRLDGGYQNRWLINYPASPIAAYSIGPMH